MVMFFVKLFIAQCIQLLVAPKIQAPADKSYYTDAKRAYKHETLPEKVDRREKGPCKF